MPGIGYFAHVAKGISPKRFLHLLDEDQARSGKSKVALLADIAWCAIRYGASFNDYMIFSFWELDHAQRDAILTRVKARKVFEKANDPEFVPILNEKSQFYRRFGEYLGRDTLVVPDCDADKFVSFFAKYPKLLAKPDIGWSGKGMKLIKDEDYPTEESRRTLFQTLVDGKFGVIDQWITQHPELSRLNPNTVNTMRMCTFVDGDRADFLYAALKIGAGEHFVDNLESGGVHCPVDPDTGRLFYAGRDSKRNFHDTHPDTGVTLVGFEVPFFHEAVDLVKKAAMVVPQVRYVGWDVAITPDGPLIIEGNPYPGSFFWQLPQYGPKGGGLWPYFKTRI